MSRSLRRERVVIDATLIERLDSLAGVAVARFPGVAYPLVNKLTSAKLVSPARMPADVVTIGSELSYRDMVTGRDQQVTLTWPERADIDRGIVSVLTPIGVALLGLSVGNACRWTTRSGEARTLTVLEIVPESITRAKALAAIYASTPSTVLAAVKKEIINAPPIHPCCLSEM
ncbi:nucleoside diphosphate kinase regulator [Roseinatronobacter sp. S2]|uniref:nucleoside diphosphate kinase regulator n=1 Tax=Roseinatronobacter sp. S2 TaxID=3035471 RepID=UPI00240F5458|nr:nucleoside diphosphate kinase regulator [Roseinatronobacter sp. S2]WFE77229.1 nucleoside diphosphate kinase regulator [Roseinatronobacter sp. S2]